jgi:hypothetical protein
LDYDTDIKTEGDKQHHVIEEVKSEIKHEGISGTRQCRAQSRHKPVQANYITVKKRNIIQNTELYMT